MKLSEYISKISYEYEKIEKDIKLTKYILGSIAIISGIIYIKKEKNANLRRNI